MMLTNEQLSNFLAGKVSPQEAEEIDEQVRDSATLQARVASLPIDPIVDRLRKVWSLHSLAEDSQYFDDAQSTSDEGVVLDRYCLIEKIGTGGMGQVWKARAIQGGSNFVALKLVKPGLDSQSIIERFELERKALAMMDHPCIAKVLDGGATDQGQSYFVMELVNGASITRYCDQHQLGIEQRLKLFVHVCRAVQHAHQKGIIHRDLKPSNIMVTQYDDQPLPKVIDFGLAKALGDVTAARDLSQLTEFGAMLGTVRYMSPEQVELSSWDIDTRSDIYSLGVVLYELLTGTTPIQWPADREPSLLNILRSIRETQPPRPSERMSTRAGSDSGEGIFSSRAVRQILRRDLDWVVMKAIEKNRERRYQTADAFAHDIDRYLTGQPVTARPPSASYRIGKFVTKNRGAVSMAVAAMMIAVAGIASALWTSQAENQKRAVYAAASYSSIINELNLLSVSRDSGWTHRGLELIREASSISTPLRDARQLRDWAAALLTVPDINMTVRKRFAANLTPTDITYSPSGRRLAVGFASTDTQNRTTVALIDLDTDGQQWITPDTSQANVDNSGDPSVTSLRFGRDDDTLYVGIRNGLLLRISLDQSPPAVICKQASRGGVLVRLSGDGRYCVTATSRQQKQPGEHDERIRCFDASTLDELGVSNDNQRVKSLSIAPDSSRMAISWDLPNPDPPESFEYSLPTLEHRRTFSGESAQYHPLGHAVYTGGQATYKRLNLDRPHDAAIYLPSTNLAWKPHRVPTFQVFQIADNGSTLTASAPSDRCIFCWRESEAMPMLKFRLSENRDIVGYALSPAMDSIAVMTDDALELYDYTERIHIRRVITLPYRPIHCAVAPDQHEFATLSVDSLVRYQLPSVTPILSRPNDLSAMRHGLAYDPKDQKLASAGVLGDRTLEIAISDRASVTPRTVIQVPCEPEERFDAPKIVGLAWIDEDHLIAAIDFRLMVWNTNSGMLETVIPQHNRDRLLPRYRAMAVRPDGCVTITDDGTLDHWRWTRNDKAGNSLVKVQPSLTLKSTKAEQLAWHPSGDCVIVGSQSGSIQCVDLQHRKTTFVDSAVHSSEICGAAWCHRERLITASRDGKMAIWQRSEDGRLNAYVVWDSRSGISDIDISADGKRCYVASASESISVFDLAALDTAFASLSLTLPSEAWK